MVDSEELMERIHIAALKVSEGSLKMNVTRKDRAEGLRWINIFATGLLLCVIASCGTASRDEQDRATQTPTEVHEQVRPGSAAVELLHSVPSVVAVSSLVNNAQIHAEHLTDGDLSTSWNSRTGDLEGAWIAFRVPTEAHVDRISLTVGSSADDEVFEKNYRILRVLLSRNGEPVREVALDPHSRSLQNVPVGLPGGDFRVEVLEVVRGTVHRWREVCVSELEVWGRLPGGMSSVSPTPKTMIGDLDISLAEQVSGARATLQRARDSWRDADEELLGDAEAEWLRADAEMLRATLRVAELHCGPSPVIRRSVEQAERKLESFSRHLAYPDFDPAVVPGNDDVLVSAEENWIGADDDLDAICRILARILRTCPGDISDLDLARLPRCSADATAP